MTMADDDQVSSLAARVERFVLVTLERTAFKIVSQMRVSSCWRWSMRAAASCKANAVANLKYTVQWNSTTLLTMYFRFTRSITASVADD